MNEVTIIKLRSILNLARTAETIWIDVMGDIVMGRLDIRRVWDMNSALIELLRRCEEVLEDEKS